MGILKLVFSNVFHLSTKFPDYFMFATLKRKKKIGKRFFFIRILIFHSNYNALVDERVIFLFEEIKYMYQSDTHCLLVFNLFGLDFFYRVSKIRQQLRKWCSNFIFVIIQYFHFQSLDACSTQWESSSLTEVFKPCLLFSVPREVMY